MTTVVNAKRLKPGWKADPQNVDVRRARNGMVSRFRGVPGYLGNPYKIGVCFDRDDAVRMFRLYAEAKVKSDPNYREAVRALAGKTLVCACAPKGGLTKHDPHVCHGQVLAEIAERLAEEAVELTDGQEERYAMLYAHDVDRWLSLLEEYRMEGHPTLDRCQSCGEDFGSSGETSAGFNAECVECGRDAYDTEPSDDEHFKRWLALRGHLSEPQASEVRP